MKCIRKGCIVSRNSYHNDILFCVENIINSKYAILKGITLRITASAPLEDLTIIKKQKVTKEFAKLDEKINKQLLENRYSHTLCGKILHLDGDRKYAEKSLKYYKNLGLNAIVRNITESKQPFVVKTLIKKYKPNILIITGHDGMIKNGTNFTDIYNYRNSKYFVNAVKEARIIADENHLVIFAGACQSFFEALMDSGADLASSPGRILIDFIDPLIIAEKISITPENKKISLQEFSYLLNDNNKKIGGRTIKGTRKIYLL